MSIEIRIPRLGTTMEEGILAEWLAADGIYVKEGTPLYSLETDKAAEEIASPAGGVLRIIGRAGESYPVGALVGVLD
jgi:pyruvate/2-oxoglutarate dehydrogenase complex dihydrolipoamide acyltransferase (E2) component